MFFFFFATVTTVTIVTTAHQLRASSPVHANDPFEKNFPGDLTRLQVCASQLAAVERNTAIKSFIYPATFSVRWQIRAR